MAGVQAFLENLKAEEASLSNIYLAAQKKDPDADPEAAKNALKTAVVGATSEADQAKTQKVTDHYEGTGPSTFRRLGTLFDLAAPQDGDSTKIELEAYVPVDPTGTVKLGLHFVSEVERDEGKVKMKTELGVSVKGSIANAASISGELGGYIEVQAASGADAAELISYDLYRRARESKVFPSEMTDYMWGGRGANAGKRAENWSKELEKRVWGTLDDLPKREDFASDEAGTAAFDAAMEAWIDGANEVYVESGGYAAVKAGGNVGLAALEGAITAHAGRRIDFTSLKNRKGGAGEENVKSDSVLNIGNAQKGVGRTVTGIAAELKASAGPFEASGKLVGRKMSGGERATMGETETWSSDWEAEVEAIGKVPMAQMLSAGPGKYIALLAASIKKMATKETQSQATGAQNAGAVLSIGENLGYLLTQLANVPEEEWKPDFGPEPEDAEGAFKAEGNIGLKIKFSAEPGTMKVGLFLVKDASVEAVGLFKAAIEKSERLLQKIITGAP